MEVSLIDPFLQLAYPHVQDVDDLGVESYFLAALLSLKSNS